MTRPLSTLIVARQDIRRVMGTADYLAAVEGAFRASASGQAYSPQPMHLPTARGGFHAKGASIWLDRNFVAVKVNGNFPANPDELGLPTIQGAMLLFDGRDGSLLAVIDSIEVTIRRTAAASALAARLLARPESRTMLICGCGEQGRAHAEALPEVLPIERCMLWDGDPARAKRLAAELGAEAVAALGPAARSADVIVTCTTASEPFLDAEMVSQGSFIAAVGADNADKSEITPRLMTSATVVTDVSVQCSAMGDLHHAIAAGALAETDVHAELADLVGGAKPGRSEPDEIIIFDSTGTGLQDVAAAAAIYMRCVGDPSIRSIALSAL